MRSISHSKRRENRPSGMGAVWVVTGLVLLLLAGAGPAAAEPTVHFDPGHVLTQPNESFELSFRVGACDDSITGFQLYLSFDPTVVELTSAEEGSLYAQSGYMTWFVADELEPGRWYFFNTVFGVGSYILPPGELVHLTFMALDLGHTQAHIDTIRLADAGTNPLAVAGFEHAEIFIAPATDVGDESFADLRLGPAWPNPFASTTRIPFSLSHVGSARTVDVFDVSGRHVRRLQLPVAARSGELVWDGRGDDGKDVSESVYFVRIAGHGGEASTRVVKLR